MGEATLDNFLTEWPFTEGGRGWGFGQTGYRDTSCTRKRPPPWDPSRTLGIRLR